MKLDLARLNHILIPRGKEERDRFRASRLGRVLVPLVSVLWGSLTDEGRSLATVTFVIGAVGIDVRNTTSYILFSVLAGLLAGSLASASRLKVRDLRITVDAPRRVAVDEPATFTLSCSRPDARGPRGARPHPLRVRGPFLPWDGRWLDEPPAELVLPPDGIASTTMRARFIRRGLHHLDPFTMAAVAPGGLACGPREESSAVKLHVVPRIAKVASLPLDVTPTHQPGGIARASKSGEAMDILGVRPYRPGDRVRDIHARSWARTGIPLVREYQQEYFIRIGVVLDTDITDEQRFEAAIELAAGVIAFHSRSEVLIDVLVLGDSIHEFTMGRSLGTLDQALELLATASSCPGLPAAQLVHRLLPYLDRLSAVVVIAVDEGRARRDLESAIRARGIACRTILVDAALEQDIRAMKELSFSQDLGSRAST